MRRRNTRLMASALLSHRIAPARAKSGGANGIQLPHFDGAVAGVPRWSPDGRQLAFDARPDGNANIVLVGSEGGGLRRLTHSTFEDARPEWSRDGNTIFFSSNRGGGTPQVWRVPVAGGDPV